MSTDDAVESTSLVSRAAGGDMEAWGALLARHEARLRAGVSFRLDRRLHGRLDAGDVVQEAFAAATARRGEFFRQADQPDAQPLFLWLRWMVGNTLLELHRHHLAARMRDVRRETPDGGVEAEAEDETRAALAAQLSCGGTGPATAAGRAELKARLHDALGRMDAADREVVALRHFEQLTSAEAARVLGIQERAAAKRYLRALERLRKVLAEMPGGLTGIRP